MNRKRYISVILIVFLSIFICDSSIAESEFSRLKSYFLAIPIGKNLKDIEKDIDLPKPDKTYMGSGSYHDRSFRYYDFKGLTLSIGLKQVSEDSSYIKGTFIYNGDFRIADSAKEFAHCCNQNNWSEVYDGPLRD